jgi:hypothetical protein
VEAYVFVWGLFGIVFIALLIVGYLQARAQTEAWRRIAEERRWNSERR